MEKVHYDFIDNFSTAKSPQQMLGVLARPTMQEAGHRPCQDVRRVDHAVHGKEVRTRAQQRMYASGYIDVDRPHTPANWPASSSSRDSISQPARRAEADSILGDYTGRRRAVRRHRRRRVMEAALRTAYFS